MTIDKVLDLLALAQEAIEERDGPFAAESLDRAAQRCLARAAAIKAEGHRAAGRNGPLSVSRQERKLLRAYSFALHAAALARAGSWTLAARWTQRATDTVAEAWDDDRAGR